jgi:hypothetical protein
MFGMYDAEEEGQKRAIVSSLCHPHDRVARSSARSASRNVDSETLAKVENALELGFRLYSPLMVSFSMPQISINMIQLLVA